MNCQIPNGRCRFDNTRFSEVQAQNNAGIEWVLLGVIRSWMVYVCIDCAVWVIFACHIRYNAELSRHANFSFIFVICLWVPFSRIASYCSGVMMGCFKNCSMVLFLSRPNMRLRHPILRFMDGYRTEWGIMQRGCVRRIWKHPDWEAWRGFLWFGCVVSLIYRQCIQPHSEVCGDWCWCMGMGWSKTKNRTIMSARQRN